MMGGMWPANSVCALFACTANWPRLPYTLACSISLCGGILVDTIKTDEIISLPALEALAGGHRSRMARASPGRGGGDQPAFVAHCAEWQGRSSVPSAPVDVV